jgi:glutamate decarboxylase
MQVPAYPFPDDLKHLSVLRFVVRAGLSFDLADLLIADVRRVIGRLTEQKESIRDAARDGMFSHTGK